MRYYIAAPIFTDAQLHVVCDIKDLLEDDGQEVFSPWHNSREIWKGRAPAECEPWERKKVLDDNIEFLRWADVLVAWVGGYEQGYTDPGVIWEMGYTKALSDTTNAGPWPLTIAYIHDDDVRKGMNLMLAGTINFVAIGISEIMEVFKLLKEGRVATLGSEFSPERKLLQEQEVIKE